MLSLPPRLSLASISANVSCLASALMLFGKLFPTFNYSPFEAVFRIRDIPGTGIGTDSDPWIRALNFRIRFGSGSGSGPVPALFVSDFQDANKK
jgi:hypothetical protein